MGKYGIGARVRDDDGDEGVIVDKRKGERKVRYDQITWAGSAELWMCKSDLSLLPANDDAVPEGKFKVGDRVKTEVRGAEVPGVITEDDGSFVLPYSVKLDEKTRDGIYHVWRGAHQLTLAPEWQPKVGDRVRWKGADSDFYLHGGEYEITEKSSPVWFLLTDEEGDGHSWDADSLRKNFEPLPVAARAQPEKWQPKAGDRVRMLRDGKSTTGATGKLATVEAYHGGDLTNQGDYLLNIDAPVDYKTLAVTPEYTRTKLEWIEPVDLEEDVRSVFDEIEEWISANQSLTIEAGKSYKTRDGRKVGPVEVFTGQSVGSDRAGRIASFYIESLGSFDSDGQWLCGNEDCIHDLVAEWVDPNPAAKFKVGDRVGVNPDDSNPGTVTDTRASDVKVRWDRHEPYYREWYGENELSPLSCTTPTIGDRVTLATPGTITGYNGPNVSVALSTGGSLDLPAAALVQA